MKNGSSRKKIVEHYEKKKTLKLTRNEGHKVPVCEDYEQVPSKINKKKLC